ncbi:hypothetical protein GCM10010442_77860 [Kitasatospora kifunensis]|uniref:Uncharacterized protein n=1 Tax=Kitasatospora kifunensis TaxID=58351 RepID=A0A7W7VZZ9_KITKI|nr:hypothetical protein [Kitasatospora kifunensis]
MTGSSVAISISSKVSFGLKFGAAKAGGEFSAGFEQAFSQTWTSTYQLTSTTGVGSGQGYSTGTVPAGNYAWVVVTPTVQTYAGSFVFTPGGGDEWSCAPGTQLTVEVPSSVPNVTASWSSTYCDGLPPQLQSAGVYTGL